MTREMKFFGEATLVGSPEKASETARTAIRRHEVVHLKPEGISTEPDALRSYYNRLVESIGTPVDIAEDYANNGAPTGERWSEIRYDPSIENVFRYSRNGQPFHTDESYVSTAAGVMLFYCVNAAPAGGETTFISGRKLVEVLAADRPDLLDRLRSVNVRYQKADDFKDQPILQFQADGAVDLNYNYFCAEPNQPSEALDLNAEFLHYIGTDFPAEHIQPVALQPGEGVTWRDDLVLHGRNSFVATEAGDRWIWKTGLILPAA